jgi:hypothetical protein
MQRRGTGFAAGFGRARGSLCAFVKKRNRKKKTT